MKVGIAGLGGIGSNVARQLVQSGVMQLKIVDFDRVELSNLNRQFYTMGQAGQKKTDGLVFNLKGISPEIKVEAVDCKIGPGHSACLFDDCDVVAEGFDHKQDKKMLIEELSATGKPVVASSGIAGSSLDDLMIKKMGTCWIVGDLSSDQDHHSIYPPKIAAVAALMADRILKIIEELKQ